MRMTRAENYAQSALELGKDVAAAAIDAASILTPLVPREAAEWAGDRLHYDGWFDETCVRLSNGAVNGNVSGALEMGGGAVSLVIGAGLAMTGAGAAAAGALIGGGAYALAEGLARYTDDEYSSTLPVTLASYAVQKVAKALPKAAGKVRERVKNRCEKVCGKENLKGE